MNLYSLQKNEGAEQALQYPDVQLESFGCDFDISDQAFEDTAAIMKHLDLIITSDTSIAHLSGALGFKTWVILKKIPELVIQ